MTPRQFYDNSGKCITVNEIDGRLLPATDPNVLDPFDPDVIRAIPNLELRKNDVFLCSYPKSGTHWLFDILQMLLNDKSKVLMRESMVELADGRALESLSSRRVLVSHQKFQYLPKDVLKKQTKVIFVSRNPKDLVVSFYNHLHRVSPSDKKYFGGSFEGFLQLFVDGHVPYGSWFEYILDVEKRLEEQPVPMYNVRYENMKLDPVNEMKKLANFLEVEVTENFIREVIRDCSFEQMMINNTPSTLGPDAKPVIYRKGEVGDWKNWFTVAKNKWFTEIYNERMKGSKLGDMYLPC